MLLMVLFRFSRPRRIYKDMEAYFGYRRSKISASIKAMVHALHALSLQFLDNPSIFQQRMAYFAERIFAKCGVVQTVCGFIDGTLRKTCRPSFFQKLLYSGHKRAHGIQFQSVVAPDGFFTCMFGPITGNRHDSYMLAMSGLIPKLQEIMPPPSQLKSMIMTLYRMMLASFHSMGIQLIPNRFCFFRIQESSARISRSAMEYRDVEGSRSR
jgi:hypothetical protein